MLWCLYFLAGVGVKDMINFSFLKIKNENVLLLLSNITKVSIKKHDPSTYSFSFKKKKKKVLSVGGKSSRTMDISEETVKLSTSPLLL